MTLVEEIKPFIVEKEGFEKRNLSIVIAFWLQPITTTSRQGAKSTTFSNPNSSMT